MNTPKAKSGEPVKRDADQATLEGSYERTVFSNADNHFTVARLRVAERTDFATIVGHFVNIAPGTSLRLRGQWQTDKRFGEQFRVASYVVLSPATLDGIERYLGSGLVSGVGPALAHRIVAKFGLETLAVIEKEPQRLADVPGIGAARAERISSAWREQRAVADVMLFLQGLGVSPAFAARIYKHYGDRALDVVREDPYRLALDVWGIGFKTADEIALHLGIARDAPRRAQAGVLHILGSIRDEGHVFAIEEELAKKASESLEIDLLVCEQAIASLVQSGRVIRCENRILGQVLYPPDLFEAEVRTANHLARLIQTPAPPIGLHVDSAIHRFELLAQIELALHQREAVAAAATGNLVVITGGPGVGKTTVVRALLEVFSQAGRSVALAAPTGRAAKRMAETTGHTAVTLHRLLEWSPRTATFNKSEEDPLGSDVVIVDETSMVDIELMSHLTAAVKSRARLVLVGDIDQLPAVGPGSVLADVISSGHATVVRLTEVFRQAAESQIVTNAHRVNQGLTPEDNETGGDFYFVQKKTPEEALAALEEIVCSRIPRRFGFDPVRDIQVLTPMHRGLLGTIHLNEVLQKRLNPLPTGPGAVSGGAAQKSGTRRKFRIGDKVMQIRNNYERDIFNGDVGRVVAAGDGSSESSDADDVDNQASILVDFDGRTVDYPPSDTDELVHAFAVTVHKAQGSEYPAVVIPLLTQHYMMLKRSLLYTAITRGKKLVVLIGQPKAVALAVREETGGARLSALNERIRAAVDKPAEK